jgi:DNA repair protein RecO (recombination protein O)
LNFTPVRGFVLGASAYGEADKIIQLFTLSLGRVKAVAKGVRKPRSKLAPAVDLLTESAFSLHRKAGGSIYVLSQAKVGDSHSSLKRDLPTLTALQVLGEVLGQSLPEAEPHEDVYVLLKRTLLALSEPSTPRELLVTAFTLKLLDLLGYPLELGTCADCGASLKRQRARLVPHRGGALCGNCAPAGTARSAVPPSGLEVLKKLRSLPVEKAHVLRLRPAVLKDLFLTVMDYLEGTLERPLKTVDYYLQLSGT